MALLWSLAKWTIVLVLALWAIDYWVKHKSYIFSIEEVHRIASKHAGKVDPEVAFRKIHADFKKAYPDHILPAEEVHWIWMNAGGWMCAFSGIHGSMTEYIIFFGTAIETSGHSGRYWANVSDTIVTGRYERWDEGQLKSVWHEAGETVVHGNGEAAMIHFTHGTWMVEYGRGFIPLTMPFSFASIFFNTLDFHTFYYTLRVYVRCFFLEAGKGDPEVMYQRIHADFKKKYPDHILPQEDLDWVFINAGGWMGAVCAIHGSMTEYILFFGTAIETSGHSGRYWANISDTILTGKFEQWKEGELKSVWHKPGENVVHRVGESSMIHFAGGTWMVEYGRGFVPATLPISFAGIFFSTLDFYNFFYSNWIYVKCFLFNAGLWATNFAQ